MSENPLVYLFTKCWQYAEGFRKSLVLTWIMFFLSKSTELFLEPLIWAWMMNIIQAEGITSRSVWKLLWLLFGTFLMGLYTWALHGPARCMERRNAFRIRTNYRRFLLQGVMTLPLEWHTNHHSGDTSDKIEKGTNGLYSFAEEAFEPIYGIVQLVVAYALIVYYSDFRTAVIILGMFATSFWITTRFDRVMIPQYKKLNRSENSISQSIIDATINISTVIILRVESFVFKAIMKRVEEPFELYQNNQRLNELKWFATSVCGRFTTLVVLGLYYLKVKDVSGGVMIGTVFLIIRYLGEINEVFFRFTGMYSGIVRMKTKVANAEELSRDFVSGNFTNHVLPKVWHRLEVSNLNFSYNGPEARERHLDDVSFFLMKGEKVAFVGESGSGKTTCLKIMRDLYHPQSGTLVVDGQVIPDGFPGISRAISLIPQKPEVFENTIWENITMGAEYDPKLVLHYSDLACFTKVAEKLPKKFDSIAREKGVNLSEGQQQRLTLARGLLACHGKDIVLLDEPTSSLDAKTERMVYRNIFREFQDKAIVSSIHRLHLLPLFDRIYVFEGGRVVASGTFNELLQNSPEFQKLWGEQVSVV